MTRSTQTPPHVPPKKRKNRKHEGDSMDPAAAKKNNGKPMGEEEEESFFRMLFSMTAYLLIVLLFLGFIAAAVGSALGYYRAEVVLSGSMRPEFNPGDVVVAFSKPKEYLRAGDVIIFRSPEAYGGDTVTHRVVSARLTESGDVYVRTKGDANNAADPWEARVTSSEVWEVRTSVPYVGYIAYHARTWWPLFLAIAVAIPMLGYVNGRVKETYGLGKKGKRKDTRRARRKAVKAKKKAVKTELVSEQTNDGEAHE